MTKNTETIQEPKTRELVITRIFDAPRSLVWKTWTDPEHIMKWWGPKGYSCPVCKVDFRTGGKYLYCMRNSDGQEFWSTGTFQEIKPMEKIVATDNFSDANGNVVPAAQVGMPGEWPEHLLTTVTFEEEGNKTRMTLRHSGIPAGVMEEMTQAGWNESLDKMGASMNAGSGTSLTTLSETSMVMSRIFDAPRDLVFKVLTDPKSIPHWWGPRYMTTKVDKMDVKPGGSWRYVQRKEKGQEYAFHGDYLEVKAPERMVSTFEFEGMPGHVMTEVTVLEDLGGKTRITVTSSMSSKEALQGMVNSGMEDGAVETWDRLEEYMVTKK